MKELNLLRHRAINLSSKEIKRLKNENDEKLENPTAVGLPNGILERARVYARQHALEHHASIANSSTDNTKNQ